MERTSRTSPSPVSRVESAAPGMARVSGSPAMRLRLSSRSVAEASNSSMGRSLMRVSTPSAEAVIEEVSPSMLGISGVSATPNSRARGCCGSTSTSSTARSPPSSEVETSCARRPRATRSST